MYTLLNLKSLAKNSTAMFIILAILMYGSFNVMFFGVGLFYQYNKNIEDSEIDTYVVSFTILDDVTKGDLQDYVESLSDETLKNVSYITCFSSTQVSGIDEEAPLAFYIQYENGSLEYSNEVFDPMIDDLILKDGRFFTQEEFSDGEKKAIVMGSGNEFQTAPSPEYSDTVTIFGEQYDVIGVINPNNSDYYFYSIYVPFNSIPDNAELFDGVYFSLNKKITESEYDAFTKSITNYFGDSVTVNETQMDLKSNNSYYLTVILISVLIGLLSALNISILYNYIIISRQRQMTIMRLCGGISSNLCISTANEILLIMIPISVLSALTYDKLLLPILSERFSVINDAYSVLIYAEIIVIYCAVSYLLNLILLHKSLGKEMGGYEK